MPPPAGAPNMLVGAVPNIPPLPAGALAKEKGEGAVVGAGAKPNAPPAAGLGAAVPNKPPPPAAGLGAVVPNKPPPVDGAAADAPGAGCGDAKLKPLEGAGVVVEVLK
jgi:hypothetical protein